MTASIATQPAPLPTSEQRSRAVRTVAAAARDAADLAELLDMLGLQAREAREPVVFEPPVPHVRGNHRLTIAELDALVAAVAH
jgi:hypothetical protein